MAPHKLPTIAIYMPLWLQKSEASNQHFFDELNKTIKNSKRYRVLPLDLPKISIVTKRDQQKIHDHNLVLVVQHDSHFYSKDLKYKNNVEWLQNYIPFLNPMSSHKLGHDKTLTKQVLRQHNIPVLDDYSVRSLKELEMCMTEHKWYVIKPTCDGGGNGVRLIKRNGSSYSEYSNGKWIDLNLIEGKKVGGDATTLQFEHRHNPVLRLLALIAITFTLLTIFVNPIISIFSGLISFVLLTLIYIESRNRIFTYDPMLVEPYFNDDPTGFASLRCTVIGDRVVESVKRVNKHNITSNISHGGEAEKIDLTDHQKKIAVAAAKAIGAECAGVDMLVCDNECVIGEINIGPVTLFGEYTGVNVGKLLGEYLIEKCDRTHHTKST